jgi:transposase
MKMIYVGADVHQTSTTLVTLDHRGREQGHTVIRTTPELLLAEVQKFDAAVCFAVEESNHARWIYELLESVVDQLIVCDPKRNKFADCERKTDKDDARGLAQLAYMGQLKSVYHGDSVHSELKELVKSYERIDRLRTNAMNALRGVFANDGTWSDSSELYSLEGREAWLSSVQNRGRRHRLLALYAQFDALNTLKAEAKKEMVRVARRKQGWKWIRSVPGVGDVRTAQILAVVGTPHRFRTKRQFWAYCGFAVVHFDTDEYDSSLRLKKRRKTRGLNRNRNAALKNAFKGAAQSTLRFPDTYPEIPPYFERRAEAKGRDIAAVDLARKLSAIALTLWKREEEYDPKKASW